MDFSSICRTCIKTFSNIGLNPIFLSEDTHERFSSAFYSCTGVQVKFNDGLPQNMCTACMNQYNSTLKFRKQCKQAEKQLLKIKTEIDCKKYQNEQCFNENTEKNNLDINATEIKSEFNIKKEFDINVIEDENKPLKYFIKNKESNSLLKINKDSCSLLKINKDSSSLLNINKDSSLLKINKNDENNTPNTSDSEFFNDNITFNKNSFKTENTDSKTKTKLKLNIPETNDAIDIPYVIMENVKKKTMRVVCKLCQKELSIRSIDSHMMRSHPGADPRKVKCELCDKYVMKEKLNRHRVMMHGSVGVRCGYCKSEFNSKEALVSHVATCTDKKKRRKGNESGRAIAECDICHMTMQKASLNKHKAVKHAGLRPVCEHCGKSFGNKFRLNEHYRAKHGYEKFKCSYCDFRSAGIMAMRNHERRHRGEKPYICETCGAKFHAAYLLMQHKHSHNTEKLVKCDLCPASFKANNNLHMHKLTCHSKSYYSCTLCSRTYKCRYYGIKHVRLAHHVSDASEVIKVILARQ